LVPDDEIFYRRVIPRQLTRDNACEAGWRISSADWDDPDGDPSVYSASALAAEGLGPEAVLVGFEHCTLVSLTAAQIREQSQKQAKRGVQLDVQHDIDLEDPIEGRGRAHHLIIGLPDKKENRARKDSREALCRNCTIVTLGEKPTS
jgi:hypothetical protein